MISKEDYAVVKALKKRGVYVKDIAAELGVHPKTVSRALERGEAPRRKRKQRSSKLDPYKGQIDQLLAEGVWNAVVVYREIEAAGYEGKTTILREYIAPKRALRAGRATVRFETEPGQQVQSDWGEIETVIGGERQKVYFIVNQLGYSRRFHFWCTKRMDAEHTYEGVVRSLEYFGGCPKKCWSITRKWRWFPTTDGDKCGSMSGFWTWQATMALSRGRVGPTERGQKAKMSGWWATSNITFLCDTGPLTVGRT